MDAEPRRPSIRERFREQVRDDVKAVALEQLAEGGAQSISLNAIAKELGVSGPALYRYYANRDELLSSLVIDAYHDLRDALAAARGVHGDQCDGRINGLARAYRSWARDQPYRYELLFKPPLPGYDAHSAQISEAGRSVMGVVLAMISGRLSAESSDGDDGQAVGVLDGDEVLRARSASSPEFQLAVRVWSRLHGFVSLELGGAYAAMTVDADALFDTELTVLADSAEAQS
ncbi:TetR/AcrR family transcriptional regulator [Paramicrobacterium chengjingii]|uniref:TetR/AcrR family transcriptional regulator n=1 Tax=Paramicrobacterium chengjingii TaxID=2769067 RepID=UPI00142357D9|nr:TetR/AcrR family transcriptional regulator [Microbacterium chengjingii]